MHEAPELRHSKYEEVYRAVYKLLESEDECLRVDFSNNRDAKKLKNALMSGRTSWGCTEERRELLKSVRSILDGSTVWIMPMEPDE